MKKCFGFVMALGALFWNIGKPILEVVGNFQTFQDLQKHFWPQLVISLEANWLANSPVCVILLASMLNGNEAQTHVIGKPALLIG